MEIIRNYITIFILGGCATVLRATTLYLLEKATQPSLWWIVLINTIGCCIAGIIYHALQEDAPYARYLLYTGILGAFTTFSALIVEASILIMKTQWLEAFAYLFIQNSLGILAFFLGKQYFSKLSFWTI